METMSIPGILVYESGKPVIRSGPVSLPLKGAPAKGVYCLRLWRLELSRGTRWKVVRSFRIK